MSKYRSLQWLLACVGVTLCALGWAADLPPAEPHPLDFTSLVDQFGQPFSSLENTSVVMLVSGMKAKGMAHDALEAVDTSCLRDKRLVYLANISGMPKMISKLIAVPRMRELDYPVWLDYSGQVAEALPRQKGRVTVMKLNGDKSVAEVSYTSSAEPLKEALLGECAPLAVGGANPG
ncbi:MAG: hypothetical protein EP334_08130 [Gammaproteobacteria bacterium]|nr:MAG: hypothetical protein EP334_08130 [Gammaproteobacteria bacterium]